MAYDVIARSVLLGSGSNTADHFIRLIDAGGAVIESSADLDTGDFQVRLPAEGLAPEGTAYIELSWLIRGVIAAGTTRRIEIHQVLVTQLGADGSRPFKLQEPYIRHLQGYVGESVSVDMVDCFQGTVTGFTNDASIPMTVQGTTLTFTPTAERALSPAILIHAENSAGQSLDAAQIYLDVDPTPAVLSAASLDPGNFAQLNHQYIEPGQALFPIDSNRLFTGGLPPFTDALVSNPSWVEMPVNGLIGGRCPVGASPTSTPIVVRRTDARGHTAQYTLNVSVIAPLSRTPTHFPANSTALNSACGNGGNVVQLQANTTYSFGNMYGKGLTTTTAANPVIILGAPGAKVTYLSLNTTGHYVFENVAFELAADAALVSLKSARGGRFVNCSFKGFAVPVDLDDGIWVKQDLFRYAGNGITSRGNSFLVLEGCSFEQFNTSFSITSANASSGIFNTTSTTVADDHAFIQQSTAVWLENVDLLGHGGNHTTGEHRDVIQLANPNQPPNRHVLLRRVFGYGDGQSQALFIENEDQRIASSRIPNWPGNHRDVLVEHCVFVGNAAHGISLRGMLDFTVRNCLTLGHPDENYMGGSLPAYGQLFVRQVNERGLIQNTIADKITVEVPAETANTDVALVNNLDLDTLPGGYATNRAAMFPNYSNTALPMKQRLMLDATWAANNPGLGPDIVRP